MMKAIINGAAPVTVEPSGNNFLINGKELIADLQLLKTGTYHLIVNQRSYTIDVVSSDRNEKKHSIRVNGKNFEIQLRDRYDDLLHELGMDAVSNQKIADLKAPMPGLVVAISVEEGQAVKKGDTLVILEAMKMENSLKAIADATVKKIAVNKGQAVEKNEVLIHLV